MTLKELDRYLNQLLKISEIHDVSINGIQIGNESQPVQKIALAVDANLNTIKKAVEHQADTLLVHHGIFWGRPFAFKGPDYLKIENLVKNNMALYAAHLPLDLNAPLGNNYQIAIKLGLENPVPFGDYHGTLIGFGGTTRQPIENILKQCRLLSSTVKPFLWDNRPIQKVGVVSGKGGSEILEDFLGSNYDLLITGEVEHSLYNTISDWKANVIALGHYESEKFGVLALGNCLKEKFGLKTFFIEEQTGF